MKYCPKCWAECVDGTNFCIRCGAAVTEATDTLKFSAEEVLAEEVKTEKTPTPEPETFVFAGNKTQTGQTNQAAQKKIETHLVKAIISAVCCCIPFGIVAIIFASQVHSKQRMNDYEGAMEASKKASLWANLSIAVYILFMAVLMVIGFLGADSTETFLNIYNSR